MYTGVQSSRNGYRSISYPMTDKEDQKIERIAGFACGGGILDTGSAESIRKQFARVWLRGGRRVGDIQGYNFLMSFSRQELGPEDPESVMKAEEIGMAVMN